MLLAVLSDSDLPATSTPDNLNLVWQRNLAVHEINEVGCSAFIS